MTFAILHDQVCARGHSDDAGHLLRQIPVMDIFAKAATGGEVTDSDARLLTVGRVLLSLWKEPEEKHEQLALDVLPALIYLDCYQVLGHPWVRKLIAGWHGRGEEGKIRRVFFGHPRRGPRGGLQSAIAGDQRDAIIKALIAFWHKEARLSIPAAIARVTEDLPKHGIERLSEHAVRTIHYKPTAGRQVWSILLPGSSSRRTPTT